MEESIFKLSNSLSHYNPEAMAELKKTLWKGTDHWDHLLAERAAISGRLVLSTYTKQYIAQFAQKSNNV
jgi:methylglutaconyl-CoA hydratase